MRTADVKIKRWAERQVPPKSLRCPYCGAKLRRPGVRTCTYHRDLPQLERV